MVARHFQSQFSEKKQGLPSLKDNVSGGGKYFNGFIPVQKLWLHIFAEEQDCSHFIFAVEAFEKLEYSKNFSIRKNH